MPAASRTWSAYLDLVEQIPVRTQAIYGRSLLPVPFLPSGVQFTTQANTVVSYNCVLDLQDQGIDGPGFEKALAAGKQPTKLAFWTCEQTTNLLTDGPLDVDFLGLNLRVFVGVAGPSRYVCLRESTLMGRPLYFESLAAVDSAISRQQRVSVYSSYLM